MPQNSSQINVFRIKRQKNKGKASKPKVSSKKNTDSSIDSDDIKLIAKEENKLVHVWTIDNKEEMFKLIDFGVDGIMTDKPSILKQAMTERGFSDLGNSP